MKQIILPVLIAGIFSSVDGHAAADILSPVSHIKREIEHTKQTLSLLEGCLAEQQKKEIVIDYRQRGVCAVDVESLFTLHYSKVLEELLRETGGLGENKPVTILLSKNYLEDGELQKIVSFILNTAYIRDNLVEFDVSNNHLKKETLPALKNLVQQCPRLTKLNMAINYISFSEFEEVFGKLPRPTKEKVIFSVY